MELYKVLTKALKGPYQDFQFKVGIEHICEDFDEDETKHCSRGFYAVDVDGLPFTYNIDRTVWRCEVGGKAVEIDQFKRRYERIRVIEEVKADELKNLALAWEPKVGYKLSEVLFPINPLTIIRKDNEVSDYERKIIICLGISQGISQGISWGIS